MSRIGTKVVCVVGFAALLAVGGQSVYSQATTTHSNAKQRLEYLCLDNQAERWAIHGPGQDFDGTVSEFAKKLGLKLGDPAQEGFYNKLTADALNRLAAEGWELSTSNAMALQYSFHVTYIFKRVR